MTNAARVHAIERGKVIGRHTMVAFGGGAPLHAGRLAQKLGIGKVVIPKGAGVGSAIGFLLAPISYEVVRSRSVNFSNFDAGSLNTMLDEMYNEALGVVQKTAGNRSLVTTKTVELRYVGQGHDLPIPLDDRSLLQEDAKCLRSRFEELYQDIYGLRIEDMDIQSVSWSVTVATESERPSKALNPALQPEHQVNGIRQIYDAGLKEMVDYSVYWRFDLEPGAEIVGPAVIAEDETSTIVPAHFTASINSLEYIVMENQAKESA